MRRSGSLTRFFRLGIAIGSMLEAFRMMVSTVRIRCAAMRFGRCFVMFGGGGILGLRQWFLPFNVVTTISDTGHSSRLRPGDGRLGKYSHQADALGRRTTAAYGALPA